MQDHIPDALITAFERQYDSSWNDPQLRNERLAMRNGWAAAMEAKPCLHQIQEPAPATAMDALREAEAALEVAMARILKADPGHSICVTSEAKALVAVRAALAATPAAEHATLPAELATQAAQPVLPTGWVPCVVTYEGQHPEEVAYGPQIMMDRLKKWLERYFEMKAAAPVVLPEPVPTPCRSMFATQREYADAMAQHRKNWAEIEAERGMLATGGQAQAVEQAPVLYVSKGQLDNHRDPDGPNSANAGRYLPCRITPAGKFTTPLFAAPQAQAVEVDDHMALAFHHAITDGAIGQDDLNEIKIGLRAVLANLHAPQAQADARDADDAALIEWLSGQYLAADFHWGEPKTPVLVIEIPATASVCGDFRTDVRAAIAAAKGE